MYRRFILNFSSTACLLSVLSRKLFLAFTVHWPKWILAVSYISLRRFSQSVQKKSLRKICVLSWNPKATFRANITSLYVRNHEKPIDNSAEATMMSVKMPPDERVKRQSHLHKKLMEFVQQAHKKFLAELTPPIVVTEKQRVTSWHSKFKVRTVRFCKLPFHGLSSQWRQNSMLD